MAKKRSSTRKPGRPAGSKTQPAEITLSQPSRCPYKGDDGQICGSTEREAYFGTVTKAIAGTTMAGEEYTHVIWRRTRCKKCKRTRTDKSFENRG